MRKWDYRIPEELIEFVKRHVPDARPLYLAFDSPYGYLPAVQWELLATSALGRPIVRLGPNSVRPMLAEPVMDVAYCCSLPCHAGISPETLRKIEVGRIPSPSFGTVIGLCNALGMPLQNAVDAWQGTNDQRMAI